jgi:hypothetical protein
MIVLKSGDEYILEVFGIIRFESGYCHRLLSITGYAVMMSVILHGCGT